MSIYYTGIYNGITYSSYLLTNKRKTDWFDVYSPDGSFYFTFGSQDGNIYIELVN